ncbi:hypothetical protein J8F10_07750 [Gemmata sp. G18]|uniref:Uncharacterized protein n=1 Tax=Gemmata palustris TaxID=2822762 RepID=A0ABS5BN62_9BACT|nr:hypothetical protein [Gemmata palustris]MBP3955173.1 hypothetical protein [Gemmata palustris]
MRRTGLTIVYEGETPPNELLARLTPKDGGPRPLIITFGSEHVDPPTEVP